MIIPEWSFKEKQAPFKNKIEKVYDPKTLKGIAREKPKLNDKDLDKELAKKLTNPFYFTDENIKTGFETNLETQNINHANSLLTVIPNFPVIGIETRYTNKVLKKGTIYTRLINQQAFIRIMKKIREVMKLNYSFI